MIERSICYFKTRGERRETKGDKRGRPSRIDSLIYLEPVERFKNRSNVMKCRSFGDSTSSRVKDKLKKIR